MVILRHRRVSNKQGISVVHAVKIGNKNALCQKSPKWGWDEPTKEEVTCARCKEYVERLKRSGRLA